MSFKTVFYDRIATNLLASTNSDIVGPGRLSRCQQIQIIVEFGIGCTAGAVVVKGYATQACSGTGHTVATINAPGAGGETVLANATGIYPFLRCEANSSINGQGVKSIHMQGN